MACFRQAVAIPQFLLLLPLHFLAPGVSPGLSSYQARCHERDVARVQRDAALAAREAALSLRNQAIAQRADAEAAKVIAEAVTADKDRKIIENDERLKAIVEGKDNLIADLRANNERLQREADAAVNDNETLHKKIDSLKAELDQLRIDRQIFVDAVVDHYKRLSKKEKIRLLQEREAATPGSIRKIKDALAMATDDDGISSETNSVKRKIEV